MNSRIKHNFGMAKPEGYRKSQRIMKLASKLNLPLICFIDTSGAYPGKDAEERGQAEAIAKSMKVALNCEAPCISVVIGEGGSGGFCILAGIFTFFSELNNDDSGVFESARVGSGVFIFFPHFIPTTHYLLAS